MTSLLATPHCFIPFKAPTAHLPLPEKFTFPFYYQPDPLALLAVDELQDYLENQTTWQHDFGFTLSETANNNTAESSTLDANTSGKMFGVLVVQNTAGELGYLTAFSGKLADQTLLEKFVPPVFDSYDQESFFIRGQININKINDDIERLEKDEHLHSLNTQHQQLVDQANTDIEYYQAQVIEGRKSRKLKRATAELTLNEEEFTLINIELSKESVYQKNELKYIKQTWQNKILLVEQQLTVLNDEILRLKQLRKQLSNTLQNKLFSHYCFLNQAGETKSLLSIYKNIPDRTPPAGSGDCAAPKLLQYAFQQGLKPIALAEFWWGIAPKSAIRQHKNFYAACLGKCQPILDHMLSGMLVDENPMLQNPAEGKSLGIVYQDDAMLIINKPAEFLSVPGKNIEDSVYSRIKLQYPAATGPLIVHRLDMSTSGLMVIALTKRAHKNLQQQFIARTVKKRYVALIEGQLSSDSGTIDLPLRVDLNDRPRQLVCEEYGKPAVTFYQNLGHEKLRLSASSQAALSQEPSSQEIEVTRVYMYPKTGRTHQLRMHCAHQLGLGMPIIGDDLYGKKVNRLHLHAEQLILNHPLSKEEMIFQVDADF